MSELLRATPFHARQADLNRLNRWENRGGFTLATALAEPRAEALAARFGTAMADLSWQWRVLISGGQAGAFVSRLLTRNVEALAPGQAFQALWLADGGGVRGIATLARLGKDSFLLLSESEDAAWLVASARLFGASVKPLDEGVLALIGPHAGKLLAVSGFDPDLPAMALRRVFWRGLDVMLSRLGQGYEVWCGSDDALIVWDRLVAAGKSTALLPVGIGAMDLLDLESGIVRAGRDFSLAREGLACDPAPPSLGLSGLVDSTHDFNGRAGFFAAGPAKTLTGVMFEDETVVPRTILTSQGRAVGRTLSSLYSPALGRALALALLEPVAALPGTALMAGTSACRVAALPFLPLPPPLGAGDGKSPS
jgi:aminomethyltransferase